MAANKFATTLHNNSNKITVILVYALLEWVLISLLLLNSFFSYLISMFASYFGLKPPCPLCSNAQLHFLRDRGGKGGGGCSIGDQVCEQHAEEISRLSYCSNHRRLADAMGLCSYCYGDNPVSSARIAFVAYSSRREYQVGDEVLKCSCCGQSSKGEGFYPFFLVKPSWNDLAMEEDTADDRNVRDGYGDGKKPDRSADRRTETCQEIVDDGDEGAGDEHQVLSDIESFGIREASEEDCSNSKSASSSLWFEKEEARLDDKEAGFDCGDKISCGSSNQSQIIDGSILKYHQIEDGSIDVVDLGMKYEEEGEDLRVIPVEMIDASTNENTELHVLVEEHLRKCHHPGEDFALNSIIEEEISLLEESFIVDEGLRKAAYDEMRSMNPDKFRPRRFPVPNSDAGKVHLFGIPSSRTDTTQGDRSLFPIHEDFVVTTMEDANKLTALEDHTRIHGAGRDLFLRRSNVSVSALREANMPSDEDGDVAGNLLQGFMSAEDDGRTCAGVGAINDARSNVMTCDGISNSILMLRSETGGEEEEFPETPTSVDSIDYMYKKSPCDKLESSFGESLEKSVLSRKEDGNNSTTIEQLSVALEAERKALRAVCVELEEERNASAVAASQTMAMITRLQEEKAAMQMEALQYQRMMEEQSEYDQEALQLLNELMVKREKEKQELEKELEVCRKKVSEYETKERIRVARKFNAEFSSSLDSSVSGNDEEERDEMVAYPDHGPREGACATLTNEALDLEEMALDCAKHMSSLDETLSEFEEERMSILDQLRALEEKLLTMSNNGEESHDKGTSNEQYPTRDARETDGVVPDDINKESNSSSLPEDSGEIPQEVAVAEEVDRVYERLQALEADREFLNHCMNSIKQGGEGMGLLQEVLQHLRDLKSVELRARSSNE